MRRDNAIPIHVYMYTSIYIYIYKYTYYYNTCTCIIVPYNACLYIYIRTAIFGVYWCRLSMIVYIVIYLYGPPLVRYYIIILCVCNARAYSYCNVYIYKYVHSWADYCYYIGARIIIVMYYTRARPLHPRRLRSATAPPPWRYDFSDARQPVHVRCGNLVHLYTITI
jgi:hypothetical protein